jgi:hypothetical protein
VDPASALAFISDLVSDLVYEHNHEKNNIVLPRTLALIAA